MTSLLSAEARKQVTEARPSVQGLMELVKARERAYLAWRNGRDGDPGDALFDLYHATKQELRAYAESLEASRIAPEGQAPVIWPKERTVSRRDDMSQTGKLSVMLDNDSDVLVNVCKGDRADEWESATVEFCTGGSGDGRSMRTREALIALMVAIEADNAARPIKETP